MLAILLCTLSGTLFIYQGQEIAMYNFPETWDISDMKDIDSLNAYYEVAKIHDNDPLWLKKAMKGLQKIGRDNARTPVQWSSAPNAGFTTGTPWMRIHDDFARVNVESQQPLPSSPLNFWKKMLQIRKQYSEICIFGGFVLHDRADAETFTFVKIGKTQSMLVVLNFTDEVQPWDIPPSLKGRELELVVSNVEEGETVGKYLGAWEGRAYITK